MTSTRTGHFVQVWKPLGNSVDREWVEVEGRKTSTTVSEYPFYAADGWFGMSRELPRRDAVKYARAYAKAGFPARVIFRGNAGEREITDEFGKKGKK